jgi:hypothetical protein
MVEVFLTLIVSMVWFWMGYVSGRISAMRECFNCVKKAITQKGTWSIIVKLNFWQGCVAKMEREDGADCKSQEVTK